MRQFEISENTLLASEPAVQYGQNKPLEDILHFDGLTEVEVSGGILDKVIELTKLNVIELSEVLEISKPNYYRKRQEPNLDLKTIDKLASLIKLYNQGMIAFGSLSDFNRWLTQENLHMGNKPPKLFLKTERGRSRLHQAIGRVEHGIYG